MISLSKRNKLIAGVTIGSLALLALFMSPRNSGASGAASAQYYTAKRGELHVAVSEGGTLQAVNKIPVKNLLPGESKITYIIPEGNRVEKGELIVKLDSSKIEEQLKKLELDIVAARSELATAQNNLIIEQSTVDSDIRSAEKSITFAKMDLEKFIKLDKQQQLRNAEAEISQAIDSAKLAEQKYEWSQKLSDKGFETKSQVDRDELDVKSRLKSLETAKSKFKMLELYDLPKKEAQLKSEVSESEKKFTRVSKQGDSKVSRAQANLTSKENKLKLNLERLEKLNEQLKSATIYAPARGLIIYEKGRRYNRQGQVELGASIRENRTLIQIPSSDKMKVEVSIPEFHINKIKLGQKAQVTIDSIPNKSFAATMHKVAVLPEAGGWLSSSEKKYKAEVLIDTPLPNVKPSISAKAEITVAHLQDVISVPLQALKEEKGKMYCFVKSLGSLDKREVTIGLMSNSFVEITDGLKAGDEVLLTQPAD